MRRRFVACLGALAVAVTAFAGVVVAPAPPAAAADSFDPGNIISDTLFYDGAAMSAAQIQSFLDARIGACQNGRCLNVATVPVTATAPRYSSGNLVCTAIPGGTYRVSDLIYTVQGACGISAKVILVTLQKEQGLVTSRAPSDWAIRAAMGMGCPDTAPCSDAFAGLALQIIAGTTQLKIYRAGAFARQPGWHFIGYHPNSACGGTTLNIRNFATAALYNYTPYQPNAASLANPGGAGDSCSSYGNRNFFNYYTSWFGSTQVPMFSMDTGAHAYAIDANGTAVMHSADGRGSWVTSVSAGTAWAGLDRVTGVGDFDGDGHRDVVGIDASGTMWLVPSDGDAGWLARVQLSAGWALSTRILSAGDWNRDGAPDLFSIDAAGDFWFHQNQGRGTLLPPKRIGSGWNVMDTVFVPGDFDGNGAADVVSRDLQGRMWLYPGDGRGGWTYANRQIGQGWGAMTAVFSPGDWDGDGVADLLARDAAGRLLLYAGDGRGAVKAGRAVGVGWGAFTTLVGPGPVAGSPFAAPAGAGDFNADGFRDVVALSGGQLYIHTGNGRGGWVNGGPVLSGWTGVVSVFGVGDWNGDGFSEVMALHADGSLVLHRVNGDRTVGAGTVIGNGWNMYDLVFSAGDVNGDGAQDLVARDSQGRLFLHPGDGAGGWRAQSQVGNGWGGMSAVFSPGDWDGDGISDLLARTASGDLLLYSGTGDGWWREARRIGNGWAGFRNVFSPGDFDGDGNADILSRDASGQIILHLGDGRGGWKSGSGRVIGWGWSAFDTVN